MMAEAFFVRARKLAFPYADRRVAGPFDTLPEAMAAAASLRAAYGAFSFYAGPGKTRDLTPLDPQALLADDEPGPDFRRVEARRAAARELAAIGAGLGCAAVVDDWDGEPIVDIAAPSLRADVQILKGERVPIISWYGAARPLRPLPGAWGPEFNHWRTKATSFPATWAQLCEMLEVGLCAAIDGSAFE